VTRAQKVRLGIFVAVGLAALVGGTALLAGMKLGQKRDHYTVRFADSDVSLSGLEVGSPVKYSGIRVGRVETILVDPEDVSVIVATLNLAGGTPVAEDTKANLGSVGITGLKYVELTRGSAQARIRQPGEEIPAGKSLLDDLTGQADEIAREVRGAIANVTAFTDADMKHRVARVLERTEKVLESVDGAVTDNRGHLAALLQRLASTAREVEALSRQLNGTITRVNGLLDDVRPRAVQVLDESLALVVDLRQSRADLSVSAGTTLAEAEGMLREARGALGADGIGKTLAELSVLLKRAQVLLVHNREGIGEAVVYLRDTAENLSEFSEKVRDDPSLLLLGDQDEGDPRGRAGCAGSRSFCSPAGRARARTRPAATTTT